MIQKEPFYPVIPDEKSYIATSFGIFYLGLIVYTNFSLYSIDITYYSTKCFATYLPSITHIYNTLFGPYTFLHSTCSLLICIIYLATRMKPFYCTITRNTLIFDYTVFRFPFFTLGFLNHITHLAFTLSFATTYVISFDFFVTTIKMFQFIVIYPLDYLFFDITSFSLRFMRIAFKQRFFTHLNRIFDILPLILYNRVIPWLHLYSNF